MTSLRLCANLRWQAFYGASYPDDASLQAALTRDDRPFRCLQTCRPWGPDDEVTEPGACQPGRGCFEPSPLDPGRARTLT